VVDAGAQGLVEGERVDRRRGRVVARGQHRGQQVVLDLAAADRAGPQHGGGLGRHVLDPGDDRVPELGRHRRVGVLGHRGGQLLDEQRVAVRALDHAGGDLGRRRGREQRAQ
jgi:hypothetical protein